MSRLLSYFVVNLLQFIIPIAKRLLDLVQELSLCLGNVHYDRLQVTRMLDRRYHWNLDELNIGNGKQINLKS